MVVGVLSVKGEGGRGGGFCVYFVLERVKPWRGHVCDRDVLGGVSV